ncbi:P-loop containing nucleoside triphosphate hydrolase protein [Amylostereum chailletii]|nr:P-loop containing nucleoside triphosphate hydrolase protein [Amylostereum chailletii]
MARKLQRETIEDVSSQKENTLAASSMASKAKAGKAASKRRVADEPASQPGDEDAEGSVISEEREKDNGDDGDGSPKGRKRVRVNEQGDGRRAKEEPNKGKGLARGEAHARDVDGFVPGSIVRVKLKNFVTYDHVEFRPGPHLNMIIGPNGTGKSSIACAIALGLNWSPSILGRANELNAFVKMGTSDGFIEIELKGKIGKENVIIRRNLSATSKTSTFTLNGRSATGREVTQKMNELNIQVGNLCSFLPQDKVSEFAHMSPQQLLKETQNAAGDGCLTAWHETLIKEGKDSKELGDLLAADKKQLETLQERNAMLERDVQRFKERKEIERQIELLELMIPFMEYIEARARYSETKAKQRELYQRVQVLKQKNAPTLDFKKRLEKEHKRLDEQRQEKKKSVSRKFKALSSRWDENEKLEGEAEDIAGKLDSLKKEEKIRLQKIANLEKDIENIQKQLDKPVKTEKVEDIQEELVSPLFIHVFWR